MTGSILSAEKRDYHLSLFFSAADPKTFGEEYEKALAAGDRGAAVRLAASHFRNREVPNIPGFSAGRYDRAGADRGVKGMMREVNIDHAFPDGKIDFLYNPTLETPPVNHEWLWQLNRFNWWDQMSRAYADTKDETYARAFEAQLLGWIEQTDPHPTAYNGAGSAWRTIEAGLRLMGSWETAFNLFRSSPSVADESLILMAASMYRQALHLKAHPTGGNWLLMETNGVYTFASLFPEFSDAEALRLWACETIVRELDGQILPDGFQRELSPDYQLVSFNCAAGVWQIANACGRTAELPASYPAHLKNMALCYAATSTPALIQPRTNDCYTMFTTRVTGVAESIFPDVKEFSYLNSRRTRGAAPEGKTASRFLPWAGFAVMRTDWSADASYLCFDVGPLGAGHMHQDKLNIILWKGDQELLFDDGGGQYEHSPARIYGTSAYDHNTVTVDGLPQMRTSPTVVSAPIDAGWITNDGFDYAAADYTDGFGQDGNCIAVHRREVRFCKPDFFVVRDTLSTANGEPHEYAVRFHMDTLNVSPCDAVPGAYYADYGKEWDLLLVPVTDAGESPLTVRTASGQTDPCYLGWYIGRNAERNHPATTLLWEAAAAKERRFTTLLFPIRKGGALPRIEKNADGTLTVTFGGKDFCLDLKKLNA